jgi:replication factor C subunit 2/4
MDRTSVFEFHPIPEEVISQRLKEICSAEGIVLSENEIETIASSSYGSLRAALHELEKYAK